MSRIFLSHSRVDARQALALKRWLSEQRPQLSNEIFLDIDPETGLQLGARWKGQLFKSNSRCEAVICLISKNWAASHECKTEYRTAEGLGKQILCARLEDAGDDDITSEWQRCDLFANGPQTEIPVPHEPSVRFNTAALDQVRRAIEGTGVGPENFVWPPAEDPRRAPYRGWEPFEDIDAGVFFGRDAAIVRGLDELRAMRLSGLKSLFVVLGPSGSGKSSFLRAGLIPRLQREDRRFVVLGVMRPERNALTGERGLAAAIHTARKALKLRGASLGDVKRACLDDPGRIAELLAELKDAATQRLSDIGQDGPAPTLVLPLDQAEELFSADAGDQAELSLVLLSDLVGRLNSVEPGLIVAATIRTDRYEVMQNHPALAGINSVLFNELKPMPASQFKEVITGPAERTEQADQHVQFAPELVERMLADAAEGADALPLLSLTLARLYTDWIDGDADELTLADYEAMGGMGDVVNNEIDEILAHEAQDREHDLRELRSAFIPWLATINRDSDQPMRRVARFTDLPDNSHRLIEAMVAKRLLVKDTRDGEVVVEVALESLLRQWDDLAGWLREERQHLITADDVERSAHAWATHDRDSSWLLAGTRLADAETLFRTAEFGGRLAGVGDYLQASRAAEDARLAAEEEHRQAELRYAQERQQTAEAHAGTLRKRSRILAVVAIVAVIGAVVAVIFYRQADDARQQAQRNFRAETALRLIAEANDMLSGANSGGDARAFQELVAAKALTGTTDEGPLLNALIVRPTTIKIIDAGSEATGVAFSPDGGRLAAGGTDGAIRLWDAKTGQPAGDLRGHTNWVLDVAFSPVGHRLASASADRTLRVWDTDTGQTLAVLEGHTEAVRALAFGPGGNRLASAGADGTVRVWDTDRGRLLATLPGHRGPVFGVAFTSDGHRLASVGADRSVRVWDADRFTPLGAPLTGHTDEVRSVAFDRDGRRLVSAGADKTVRLWDVDKGQQLGPPLTGHTATVDRVAFSPDGRRIVSASTDKSVRLWDADTRQPLSVNMIGHTDAVRGVAFSPDGHRLASASFDRMVRVWDADARLTPGAPLVGHTGAVTSVAFSPDGHRLASASFDRMVRLWDADTGQDVGVSLIGHTDTVTSVAFSPDGHRLATASADSSVRLWNAESGRQLAVLTGHTGSVFGLAFSANGNRLASAGFDHTVRLWNGETGEALATLTGHTDAVDSVSFSADGRRLVSGGADNTLRIWDTENGRPVGDPMTGHTDVVRGVAFSPDGPLVASVSYDDTVRLWNADTGKPVGDALTGHARDAIGVVFSPDGRRLATVSVDQTVRFWSDTGQFLGAVGGHTDKLRGVAFSPDGSRVATGGYDNSVRVWPAIATPDMLCAKLTANISHAQWRQWISEDIPYPEKLCGDLPDPND